MAPTHSHPHHHHPHHHHHHHHHQNIHSSPSFAPYSIPRNESGVQEGQLHSAGTNHLPQLSLSLPGAGSVSSPPRRSSISSTSTGPPVTYLSRRFVARRISEGETGRLKEELKCQACGKGYKHISSLAKHLWEHTPEWSMTSKLLISKHQQVQLLEAASILVSLNENDEEEAQDEEAAAATAAANAYLEKQHQQQLQINDRRKSMSNSKRPALEMNPGDDTGEPFKSPFTSPSLADDSSTPSPPPHPLTPNYTNLLQQPSRSSQLTTKTGNKLSPLAKIHSRSSSMTSSSVMVPSSPAIPPSGITDSLFPATSASSLSTTSDLPSSLTGTRSSLRYDDLESADSLTKRKNLHHAPTRHSNKSYSRRMSALNPPSKVNTKLSLDYADDEDEEDDDDENVVVDDLDDGVFGEME